jgi:nucleoid-associated protein YgaU
LWQDGRAHAAPRRGSPIPCVHLEVPVPRRDPLPFRTNRDSTDLDAAEDEASAEAQEEARRDDALDPDESWDEQDRGDTVHMRVRRRRPWWVPVLVVALTLVLAAGAGFGLAYLVARLASVAPPAITLPPSTPTPVPPTDEPSPSVSPSVSPTTGTSPTPAGSGQTHVVQEGEFLSEIAAQYGVTVEAIAEANGIENPNLIEPGQELIIPPPDGG